MRNQIMMCGVVGVMIACAPSGGGGQGDAGAVVVVGGEDVGLPLDAGVAIDAAPPVVDAAVDAAVDLGPQCVDTAPCAAGCCAMVPEQVNTARTVGNVTDIVVHGGQPAVGYVNDGPAWGRGDVSRFDGAAWMNAGTEMLCPESLSMAIDEQGGIHLTGDSCFEHELVYVGPASGGDRLTLLAGDGEALLRTDAMGRVVLCHDEEGPVRCRRWSGARWDELDVGGGTCAYLIDFAVNEAGLHVLCSGYDRVGPLYVGPGGTVPGAGGTHLVVNDEAVWVANFGSRLSRWVPAQDAWETVELGPFSAAASGFGGVAVDAHGVFRACWVQDRRLYYGEGAPGAWQQWGIGQARRCALALDGSGAPHISYVANVPDEPTQAVHYLRFVPVP
jgi:hypothetical protein